MGKYSAALGLGDQHTAATTLSVNGLTNWGVSKVPAIVGGYLADRAYKATVDRFWKEGGKWVPETIGTIGVVVVGFALQLFGPRFLSGGTHMLDKLTDGMMGRMSPQVVNTVKRLLGMKPAANADLSLDGDSRAARDIAARIGASPDFIDDLASGMVQVMRDNDCDLDEGAKPEIARSLRDVARKMAA